MFRLNPGNLINLGMATLVSRKVLTPQTCEAMAVARSELERGACLTQRRVWNAYYYCQAPFNALAITSSFAYNQIVDSDIYIETYLATHPRLQKHAAAIPLAQILSDTSPKDKDGFPQITTERFEKYRDQVPHIFKEGMGVLEWLHEATGVIRKSALKQSRIDSILAAIDAIRTQVYSAAVTAPPNLWLARHILSTHKKLGIVDHLLSGKELIVEDFSRKNGLDPQQLFFDLEFLHQLGYIAQTPCGYTRHFPHSSHYEAHHVLEDLSVLPDFAQKDMVKSLIDAFDASAVDPRILQWLNFTSPCQEVKTWVADTHHMEIAYRIVPVVLALKSSKKINGLKTGAEGVLKTLPFDLQKAILRLLESAGFISDGKLTELGARAFERGPGVYGIIEAYYPYLNHHEKLLKNSGERPHVERGRNIVASQAANTKSFEDAVALVKKAGAHKFKFVTEHACGMANGLKTWIKNIGVEGFRFLAADYEYKSVQAAQAEVTKKRLPPETFVGQADISKPEQFIEHLRSQGYDPDTDRAVMIVGNGFHEVRGDNDTHIMTILETYRKMNISIVFSEESALSSEQILRAAWSTYHACFLWCHNTSGQRIRAPWAYADSMPRLSWKEVFEAAGYRIISTKGTRRTIPCDLPPERNPNISVTFFCVPNDDISFH